jgi:hypothetical protein
VIESIRQVLYFSRATAHISNAELQALARRAGEMNASKGITGALLFVDQSFIQIIEGEQQSIDELLSIIEGDPRHRDMNITLDRQVRSRDFHDWSMGLITPAQAHESEAVWEIDPFSKDNDSDDDGLVFPASQTFVMMKQVYQTNTALQRMSAPLS